MCFRDPRDLGDHMRTDQTASPATGSIPGVDQISLLAPQIRLNGKLDYDMLGSFLSQLAEALKKDDPIVTQLTTEGGDAEVGRRIAEEVRLCRGVLGRDLAFLGVSHVYSAGVSVMGAFPLSRRFLTRDTVLMIHGRKIEAEPIPAGQLTAALQFVRTKVSEYENGLRLERQGFANLIEGSDISMEEIQERALTNWYIAADQALQRRLVTSLL
jgi:ATP-dependent Clp protease protease subunit